MTKSAPVRADFASVVTVSGTSCSSCDSSRTRKFYDLCDVPTQQVRLLRSRDAALGCEKGDIQLYFCEDCGFIWNGAFHPERLDYEDDYESTQAVSPTFNRFHARLAQDLVERFDLAGKEVFEIGCGQGEFLPILCELGIKQAIGFDPVIRDTTPPHPHALLIKDWYSEKYADRKPDCVLSKMTMEHIPDPGRFLRMLRHAIGDRPDATTFAMMPETTRVLDLRAFWDIYYEHCAYFSLGSLARAYRRADFAVFDLRTDYGGQYALIGARPAIGIYRWTPLPGEESPVELAAKVDLFAERVLADRAQWQNWISRQSAAGKRIVLWGGGSKAVAFLTTLGGMEAEIAHAVDVNSRRAGTYLAGSGQMIVTPDALKDLKPDYVVLMNPIYHEEISADLRAMNLAPEVVLVESPPA